MGIPIIKSRVAAGVAFLDDEAPGWRDKVDPDTLDMSDTSNCIIGQISDDGWSYFMESYGMFYGPSRNLQVLYGFESAQILEDWFDHSLAANEYELLRVEWLKYL